MHFPLFSSNFSPTWYLAIFLQNNIHCITVKLQKLETNNMLIYLYWFLINWNIHKGENSNIHKGEKIKLDERTLSLKYINNITWMLIPLMLLEANDFEADMFTFIALVGSLGVICLIFICHFLLILILSLDCIPRLTGTKLHFIWKRSN